MEAKILIAIVSVLFSALIGLVGYGLRAVHREFKQLLNELTAYTNELKQIVAGIQVRIERGIEADIQEMKKDVNTLYERTNKHESQISVLNQKTSSTK